jgi:hypothetical protein
MKYVIVLLLTLFSIGIALPQNKQQYRNFATQAVDAKIKKENQSVASQQAKIEQFVSVQKKKLAFKKVIIPVVFHILYSPGSIYPSEEQVYSQIDALNRDFSKSAYKIKHKADTLEGFSKRAENMEIEFCLAKEGPTGQKDASIRYVQVSSQQFSADDRVKSQRSGTPPWDTGQTH